MIGDEFGSVLDGARRGEEPAFSALYRELNGPVLRYLAARAPAVAEDLASETWMAVARGVGRFEGDEPAFRAWLFTIAHRRLVQHWRDSARRVEVALDHEVSGARRASDDPAEEAMAPGEAAEAARRVAALLPPDQANVVLLRVLGGLSVQEVASILGKRPGTVRVLQHKALRRLARDFLPEPVTLRAPGAM